MSRLTPTHLYMLYQPPPSSLFSSSLWWPITALLQCCSSQYCPSCSSLYTPPGWLCGEEGGSSLTGDRGQLAWPHPTSLRYS